MGEPLSIHVGFNVNFTHESLSHYRHLDPDHEFSLRSRFMAALLGDKRSAFLARFSGEFASMPSAAMRGHLGGAAAHAIAMEAVAAYNDLGTGLTLDDPMPVPHCVRYEIVNGELCVIYNYLTDIESATGETPPPGATYHVVVCSPDPIGP